MKRKGRGKKQMELRRIGVGSKWGTQELWERNRLGVCSRFPEKPFNVELRNSGNGMGSGLFLIS
jgi:hypothetical protein